MTGTAEGRRKPDTVFILQVGRPDFDFRRFFPNFAENHPYQHAKPMRRPQIVERIRKALAEVAPGAKSILYGSEARGDARPDSDIDLLVLVDGNKLSIQDEERIIAPLYDIEIETGVAINARVLLKKIWNNLPLRTPFQVNVMNEGIVL